MTKPPYQARNPNRHAASTDPATWAPFDMALAAYRAGQADGIGFCLFGSGVAAFDLDDCINDKGELEPAAKDLIERARSYVEITPSGRGLRILVLGAGAKVHRKQSVPGANGMSIETYRGCRTLYCSDRKRIAGIRA